MKCPNYDPDAYGCMSWLVLGKCPQADKPCSSGWLPFWTPSERAGLKAMGYMAKIYEQIKHEHLQLGIESAYDIKERVMTKAIGEFVSASRKVKEGR